MQLLSLLISTALMVLPMTISYAQTSMDHSKMDHAKADKTAAKDGATHKATGVVKRVDRDKSTVTLAHGPIKSLNWPAMTMDFQVRDKASLTTLKPEQKIEFELVEEKKGSYVISRIK